MISTMTGINCIIGDPVNHSLSPAMHNAAYAGLGLDMIFLAFRVTELEKAVSGLGALGVNGISVTVPHKENIIRYAQEIDPEVKKIGAANTLVRLKGNKGYKAFNTDWKGALKSLAGVTALKNKKAVIKGAGGAARAVAFALKSGGASVKIINRTFVRAEKIVKELALDGVLKESDYAEIQNSDILVNATTLGMYGTDPLPFNAGSIRTGQIAFDTVYRPKITPFLEIARKKKAVIVCGYKMLLYQGLEQFRLFTGVEAPVDTFSGILLKSLEGKKYDT